MRLARLLIIVATWAGPASAQSHWSVTVAATTSRFSTAYHDTSTPQVHAAPWHPSGLTLSLVRDGEHFGLGGALAIIAGREAANVEDFTVLPGAMVKLFEFAPEVRWRVVTSSDQARLTLHAGPIFDLWKLDGVDERTRWGAAGGATLSMPLAGSWLVDIRGDVAISGSYMNEDETSDEVKRNSSMRRATLGLGITRRL